MLRTSLSPRKHLLLPSHPTPNGRLHLGHIAGPYLRMDVLRRALQRSGDEPLLMFAIDSFESYVLLRAHQLGLEPGQTIARYVPEIQEDLAALDIEVDICLEPLSSRSSTSYDNSVYKSIQALWEHTAIERRKEEFLFCEDSSRFIVGCWLLGKCPNCGKGAGGYSCEACGFHYRPEQLKDQRSRLEEGSLKVVSCNTLFLRVHDTALLERNIEEKLPGAFQSILKRYLERSGASLRISVPGTWGVPIKVEGESQPQIVYSGFAALGLLDWFGTEYAHRFNTDNPFHAESDVTITCSFGIDNTVTRVLSCVGGALGAKDFRPPDSFILNHFYRLEGAKFSTSRNHVIWASAIGNISATASDVVRFHLLETSPEESETDFFIDGFLATANELFEWNPIIENALLNARPSTMPESVVVPLENASAKQDELIAPRSFRAQQLPQVLRDWINLGRNADPTEYYWWLKGLALLSWPVLPKLSSALWLRLGHDGIPRNDAFPTLTQLRDIPIQLFESISTSDLKGCTTLAST